MADVFVCEGKKIVIVVIIWSELMFVQRFEYTDHIANLRLRVFYVVM